MKKMKYVIWTLDTITNVKRITTEEMMKLDLKDRQIVIYPKAKEGVGASMINNGITCTANDFPMIGLAGIIQTIEKEKEKISFQCTDLFEKPCIFTPVNFDILFIIEKNKADEKWLKPEYAWIPDGKIFRKNPYYCRLSGIFLYFLLLMAKRLKLCAGYIKKSIFVLTFHYK